MKHLAELRGFVRENMGRSHSLECGRLDSYVDALDDPHPLIVAEPFRVVTRPLWFIPTDGPDRCSGTWKRGRFGRRIGRL